MIVHEMGGVISPPDSGSSTISDGGIPSAFQLWPGFVSRSRSNRHHIKAVNEREQSTPCVKLASME